MIIDVIDMEDPQLGGIDSASLAGVSSTKIRLYGMCNGVGQMITNIIQAAGSVRTIEVLRIWAHGDPGAQNVSAGRADMDAHWAGIGVSNIEAMRTTLARLAPYFAVGARVELRGCRVAEGRSGETLLLRLASIWGVRVQAGTSSQSGLGWVGPVVEASPYGYLVCTAGTAAG